MTSKPRQAVAELPVVDDNTGRTDQVSFIRDWGIPGSAASRTDHAARRTWQRIQVPANAPAEANGLFWELDPTGAQGPQALSRLVVAR